MLTHVLNPPLALFEFVERSARRAIGNARGAADDLHLQNDDRRRLTPRDPDAGTGRAGELTRIPREECLRLLRTRHVGRLAYVGHAETPELVPVNYAVDGADRILVRSGRGPKLLAAERGALVAFEVDEIDEQAHTGWSVVVHARTSVLSRQQSERMNDWVHPWAAGPRPDVISLKLHRVEGRRLS